MLTSQKAAVVVEAVSGFLHDHHDRINADTTAVLQDYILKGHEEIEMIREAEAAAAAQEEYADGSEPDTEPGEVVKRPTPATAKKATAKKRS